MSTNSMKADLRTKAELSVSSSRAPETRKRRFAFANRLGSSSKDWDYPVEIGRVRLRNPIIAASGTYGYGLEYRGYGEPSQLGAVVVKSLTVEERPGFPAPRVAMGKEPGSMINAIGVPNPGVKRWAETILPYMCAAGSPVVASVWGVNADQVVAAAEILSKYPGPIAWEINLSCPNSEHPGSPVAHDARLSSEVCRAIRNLAPDDVGVWAKLAPDAPDVLAVGAACFEEGGADAITVSNTFPVGETWGSYQRLGGGNGGMSGTALRHHTRPLVEKFAIDCPSVVVLACGGVLSSDIALDYLELGASAVQVGTASLYDPRACHKIASGLVAKLKG